MARVSLESKPKPTLRQLAAELDDLRERVEDLEDLRDIREAVRKNAGKPLLPWSEIKKDIGLD